MVKWIAFAMAWIALVFSASTRDLDALGERVRMIEGRKCLLMAVNTPSGVASICAPTYDPQ